MCGEGLPRALQGLAPRADSVCIGDAVDKIRGLESVIDIFFYIFSNVICEFDAAE